MEKVKKKPKEMKKLLTLFMTVLLATMVFGQNQYQELLILKADGNWDKLIKKAEQYTLSDKTHKDPAPYYYLSYGLYKMSFKANRDEKYKKAYKDAFKAIGKMLRYDESGTAQQKYAEYIITLKTSLLELIQNDIDAGQPKRAFGWAMRMYKFGREYPPALFLDAALRYEKRDRTTARIRWEAGEKLLKDTDINSWSEIDKKVLQLGLYLSAKFLKKDLQTKQAKKMMNIGAPYFEGDEVWDAKYDEIVNQ